MRDQNLYCAICAAPFEFVAQWNVSQDHPGRWVFDLCAIGRVSFIQSTNVEGAPADYPVHITGREWWFGRTRITNPFTIPGTKGIKNVFKPKSGKPSGWTAYEPRGSPPSVVYPVHRMCLKVLARFLGESGDEFDEEKSIEQIEASGRMTQFYDRMCRASVSTFWHRSNAARYNRLWRDHQYFGAAQLGGLHGWASLTGFEYLLCNPVDVSKQAEWALRVVLTAELSKNQEETRNLVKTYAKSCNRNEQNPSLLDIPHGESNETAAYRAQAAPVGSQGARELPGTCISQMPGEILDMIVSQLHPSDVLALHRVNWRLHASTELTSAFWRRFLAEGAIPWLWDLSKEDIDSVCVRFGSERENYRTKELNWRKACQLLCRPVNNAETEASCRAPDWKHTTSLPQRKSDRPAHGAMEFAS